MCLCKQCHETVKNIRRRIREDEINERLRRWAVQRAEKVAKANAEQAARRTARAAVPQKVYVIGSGSHVKIGIARDVKKRVAMLQTSSPVPLTVIKQWECADAYEAERRLHKKYVEFKTSGEWFAMPEVILRELLRAQAIERL